MSFMLECTRQIMARKFHYGNKKNDSATPATGDAVQRAAGGNRGGRRGGRGKGRDNSAAASAAAKYAPEKLSMTLGELGVSEELAALLATRNIRFAKDLVTRTEREMFKVQGFNKKMLLALKRSLEESGMAFRPESDSRPAEQKPERRREEPNRAERAEGEKKGARDGRQSRRQEREERPKKLTEPLPVSEWRKLQKNGKWGFNDGFETVIPPMYDEVFFFKEGLAAVELDEKCGYINEKNEVVIPLEYETAMSFSGGLACVVKGGKCGYINAVNEVVIPFLYDAATPFEEGEAKVKKDGRWGTILPDGSVKWI